MCPLTPTLPHPPPHRRSFMANKREARECLAPSFRHVLSFSCKKGGLGLKGDWLQEWWHGLKFTWFQSLLQCLPGAGPPLKVNNAGDKIEEKDISRSVAMILLFSSQIKSASAVEGPAPPIQVSVCRNETEAHKSLITACSSSRWMCLCFSNRWLAVSSSTSSYRDQNRPPGPGTFLQSLSPQWEQRVSIEESLLVCTTMLFTFENCATAISCVCLIILVRESHLKKRKKTSKIKMKNIEIARTLTGSAARDPNKLRLKRREWI